MKSLRAGSPAPDMTMQHCTDETTDKAMSSSFSPGLEGACARSRTSRRPRPAMSPIPSAPSRGVTMTTHSEILGDFNSAYTVKATSNSQGGSAAVPRDSTTVIEAKWLGRLQGPIRSPATS
jgi:hypothetical protein